VAAATSEPSHLAKRLGQKAFFAVVKPQILSRLEVAVPSGVQGRLESPSPFPLPQFDSFLTISPQAGEAIVEIAKSPWVS
jgi:hypothetical protein